MNLKFLFKVITLVPFLLISAKSQITLTQHITNGIDYKFIENKSDTLLIYVLSINLDSCDCLLNTIKAKNRLEALDETSDMAGDSVIASINADFFESDGTIINNMVSDGYIIKAVSYPPYDKKGITYSQFAVDEDNKLHIGRFNFSGLLFSDSLEVPLYGINAPYAYGKTVLYNSLAEIPDTIEHFYFLDFRSQIGDTGIYRITGLVEDIPDEMQKEDYLLVTDNNLIISDSLKLVFDFIPAIGSVNMLTGGWPQLVDNGINISGEAEIMEGCPPRFSTNRHPRTGIGFNSDSSIVYFFAVDGRQKRSRGISLSEFADLMISEGVFYGLNLDGGGSTTMVINGKVMNNPSDLTGERKVGSAIVLKRKAGKI